MPTTPFNCGMYNHRTGEHEPADLDLTTLSPERLKDFLPQNPSAHGLLDVLIAQGSKPLEALRDVLIACLPAEARP